MDNFAPHPWLRNAHVMTLVSALWPRGTPRLPRAQDRLFEVDAGTQLLAQCHWQARRRAHPALVLVHGLEGSSESAYMRGLAEKAFLSGFHVLRLNQRCCGGTDHLTPTLYNSGLSGDYRAILAELIERDALPEIFFAGYSMGGNLVLKMAGELGGAAPQALRGVCAICPSLDLAACTDALSEPQNMLYQRHFVRRLKARMRRKARLFPGRFRLNVLDGVRTVREFDNAITAPYGGYRDAADYYQQASAARVLWQVSVPALIVTAKDDPLVPFRSVEASGIDGNPHITLVAPDHGGHCGFISHVGGCGRYWVEARVVEFCRDLAVLPCGDGCRNG